MFLTNTILGFIVALLLAVFNRNRFSGNYYLVGFFLLNSLFGFVFYTLYFSPSVTLTAVMHGHFMPLLYLPGPMAFFYVRSLIRDNSGLKKSDLLHFVPFIILTIGIIPYFFKDFGEKTALVEAFFKDPTLFMTQINFLVPQSVNIISRQAIMLIYFAVAFWIWLKNKEVVQKRSLLLGIYFKHIYVWVFLFLALSFLVSLGMLVLTVNTVYRFSSHLSFDRMKLLLNVMGICYFLLNVSLFLFPEILYGMPRSKEPVVPVTASGMEQSGPMENTAAEAGTNRLQLSQDYLSAITRLVDSYLHKKPFLNSDFSLTMMSSETNIPIHHLSYYFNNILRVSFSEWRNKLRIEYALQLIEEGFARDHSLNAVSLESGFSSQVTFIRAFKNQTGQTPGERLKSLN